MEIGRKWRFSCLFLGLLFLATTLQGVQGEVESEGPSESECRPYIEKALKELETADIDTEHADPRTPTEGESQEDIPIPEGTIDDSEHDASAGEDDTEVIEPSEMEQEKATADEEEPTEDTTAESIEETKEAESSEQGDEPQAESQEGDQLTGEKSDETSQGDEHQDESVEETHDNIESSIEENAEDETNSLEQADETTSTETKEVQDSIEDDQQPEQEQADDEDKESGEKVETENTEEQSQEAGSVEIEAETTGKSEESSEHADVETSTEQVEESTEAPDDAEESKLELSAEGDEQSKEETDKSKEESEKSVEEHDKSVEEHEKSVEEHDESVEERDKSVEEHDKSVEEQDKSVEEQDKSVEEHDKSIEESEKSEEITEKSLEQSKEEPTETEEIEDGESSEKVEESLETAEKSVEDTESAEPEETVEEDVKSEEGTDVIEEGDVKSLEALADTDQSTETPDEASKEEQGEEMQDEADEEETTESKESVPEEELILEIEIPGDLRPRDHIDQLLKLDDSESEATFNRISEVTLRDLKKLYEHAIKPLETLYKYRDLSNRHFGDSEIFSKPLVLFMGPWSGGKSSIINYLLDIEYNTMSLRSGAEPSPAYFNLLMYGEEPEILDGTQLAADFTFAGLQKFGQGLEERLHGLKLPSKLLEKINIVEIPGILEVRKQVSRIFPFNDACQWFIDRADIIFLVYDPSKLDVGPETEAILDQLKGREHQTRIILNKADQVKPEELMRVQSALIWNISPLMSSAQPPVMYTTSLWSRPYEAWAPVRLLHAQERAFLRDLRSAVDKRIENKISSARRFAVRVRNHAKMVDCYLTTYYNHKSVFGNRKQVSDQIIEHPQDYHIYEGLSTLTNISRYDLPDPDVYRDFFRLNPLYDFQQLSATCTYFRGCPINRLDVAIAYDLPEMVGKHKKMVESALAELKTES